MDTRSLGPILRYLKQIARVPDADQLTDRQLLGRFVEHGHGAEISRSGAT